MWAMAYQHSEILQTFFRQWNTISTKERNKNFGLESNQKPPNRKPTELKELTSRLIFAIILYFISNLHSYRYHTNSQPTELTHQIFLQKQIHLGQPTRCMLRAHWLNVRITNHKQINTLLNTRHYIRIVYFVCSFVRRCCMVSIKYITNAAHWLLFHLKKPKRRKQIEFVKSFKVILALRFRLPSDSAPIRNVVSLSTLFTVPFSAKKQLKPQITITIREPMQPAEPSRKSGNQFGFSQSQRNTMLQTKKCQSK